MDRSELQIGPDLPESLVSTIRSGYGQQRGIKRVIIDILAQHGEVTIGELLAAIYRRQRRELTRKTLGNYLAKLSGEGLATSVRLGTWRLTERGLERHRRDAEGVS